MILGIADIKKETDIGPWNTLDEGVSVLDMEGESTELSDLLQGYQKGIIPKFEISPPLTLANKDDIDEGTYPLSIGTERKELATLLIEEYGNESVSPECKRMVLEFIANNESVLNQDVEFVKTLTKAAHKIHKADPYSLDNLLERVYRFNLEGISLIHSGKANKFSENRILKMKSHLYSHAGYFSKTIFEAINKKEDVSWKEKVYWAKEWYRLYTLSAIISEDFDPIHSAHAYSWAADGARAVFEAINKKEDVSWKEKVHWAKEWYKLYIFSAIISEDFDPIHSAHAYSWAADGARAVFYIINKREDIPPEEKIKWVERWRKARSLAADKSMEFNQQHAAHSYGKKADAARILYYKTGDIHYATEAIDGYIKFIKYYESNRKLITPEIDELIKRCKTNLSRLEKEPNISPQPYCVLT